VIPTMSEPIGKTRGRYGPSNQSNEPSIRMAKVASTVRKAVQETLSRGLGDPRIRGLVSITSVEVSSDLSSARIRITVMPEQHESTVLRGLQSANGRFRREIQRSTRLRRVPRVSFEIDKTLKRQAVIESLLEDPKPNDSEVGES
jgi:ribosome-binding factor A